jgi:hypothetical protein
MKKWRASLDSLLESRDVYMSIDKDLHKVPEIIDYITIANQHVRDISLKELMDSLNLTKEDYDMRKAEIEQEYNHVNQTNGFRRQMIEKRPLLDSLGTITDEEFESIYKKLPSQ